MAVSFYTSQLCTVWSVWTPNKPAMLIEITKFEKKDLP